MKLETLQKELHDFYRKISYKETCAKTGWPFNPLKDVMDDYDASHPGLSAFQLKAAQYEMIAEHFTPTLFRNDPFFFETGLKMAEYDGRAELSSGGWMFMRNEHLTWDLDPVGRQQYQYGDEAALHLAYNIFDIDHHGFPYRSVLSQGLSGIFQRIQMAKNEAKDAHQQDFYESAQRGIMAVKKMGEKFAVEAERLAGLETDSEAKAIYLKIAVAARKVPWQPAETFYEGLAVIWFCHELGSVMDGVGMSIIGAPDQLLIDLYREDIATGRETPESADALLRIWMIHTDCKLDFSVCSSEQFNAGEQGDTMTIGGNVNDLTYMLLRVHRDLKLIYPKIHCRINAESPREYVKEACETFFTGRNVLDFLNDELIIPAQIKCGKDPKDAADYVAGGCWEIMLEECEHAQGANCYFDLAKVMDLSIQSTPEQESKLGLVFIRPDGAATFDDLYDVMMKNAKMCLEAMLTAIRKFGKLWPEINPSPLYSSCLKGCIESGRDYSEGGAKYSPHGVPLTDVATFVNSLLVMKTLCFEKKICTLEELLTAVRDNWKGHEALRNAALASPYLGDGSSTGSKLLARILNELADYVACFKNERDCNFQCGIYSYVEVVWWGKRTNATPDGRFNGDFLSQGLTPTRLHATTIPDVFREMSMLPLNRFPANSVMTTSLPLDGLDVDKLASLIYTWAQMKVCGMLQLNCVNKEDLDDAIIHPENHQDLIVRLYGYSTRFVTLEKIKQREFISRQIQTS